MYAEKYFCQGGFIGTLTQLPHNAQHNVFQTHAIRCGVVSMMLKSRNGIVGIFCFFHAHKTDFRVHRDPLLTIWMLIDPGMLERLCRTHWATCSVFFLFPANSTRISVSFYIAILVTSRYGYQLYWTCFLCE